MAALGRDMYRSLRRLGVAAGPLQREFRSAPMAPQSLQKGFAAIRRLSAARDSFEERTAPQQQMPPSGSIAYERFMQRLLMELEGAAEVEATHGGAEHCGMEALAAQPVQAGAEAEL